MSKRSLTLALTLLFGLPIHAQEEEPLRSHFIVGASNPELISDAAVFTALSGQLRQCEIGVDFCIQIEGVDMTKALELSQQFGLTMQENTAARHAEFCTAQQSRRVPYRDATEFGMELARYMDESNRLRAATFVTLASHILGADGMQRLMNFANGDFRTTIQEGQVNFVAIVENSGMSPEQFLGQFCASSSASPGEFHATR